MFRVRTSSRRRVRWSVGGCFSGRKFKNSLHAFRLSWWLMVVDVGVEWRDISRDQESVWREGSITIKCVEMLDEVCSILDEKRQFVDERAKMKIDEARDLRSRARHSGKSGTTRIFRFMDFWKHVEERTFGWLLVRIDVSSKRINVQISQKVWFNRQLLSWRRPSSM